MFCGPVCFIWDKILAIIMMVPFVFGAVVGWSIMYEDWKKKRKLKKKEKCK